VAIYGIGVDLLRVERGERLWQRFGERATRKLLHPAEAALLAHRRPGALIARSFAVKEAFVKALGTGFAELGIEFREIGAGHAADGRPALVLSAALEVRVRDMGVGDRHLSISDEGGVVIAFVVLERRE